MRTWICEKNHYTLRHSKEKVRKAFDFKESLHLFHLPLLVSVHPLESCQQMCYYTSANIKQGKTNRQIAEYLMQNIWQWQIFLTLSFCISFIRQVALMLCEPPLTFLKNLSGKVFSDKSSLLETQLLADNKTHTQFRFTKVTFMILCAASVVHCFDLV